MKDLNAKLDIRNWKSEKRVKELEDNFYVLMHAVDDLEKMMKLRSLPTKTGNRHYICNYCLKAFENEQRFRDHLRIDHG